MDFRLNLPEDLDYIELFSSVIVLNSGNPMEAIKRFSGEQDSTFNEITGAECAGYSIRIGPKNSLPMDKNWFDISITPRFATANREYYVEVVFRKEKDIDGIIDFAEQLDAKISAIIDKIGGT